MVIVDTSVAFKWFEKKEENRIQARRLLRQHLLKENEIVIPSLLLYEISNAWSTKSDLKLPKLRRNLKSLEKYFPKTITPEFGLIRKAIHLSRKYQISAYDAIYAVLAKEKKCNLITADEKFADKVNLSFVKKLSEI